MYISKGLYKINQFVEFAINDRGYPTNSEQVNDKHPYWHIGMVFYIRDNFNNNEKLFIAVEDTNDKMPYAAHHYKSDVLDAWNANPELAKKYNKAVLIEFNNIVRPAKQAMKPSGMRCLDCKEFYEYVSEPNHENGLVCYPCRTDNSWKWASGLLVNLKTT